MRTVTVLGAIAGLALSACAPASPYGSTTLPATPAAPQGGFAAYELERAQLEAQLTGAAPGGYAALPSAPPAGATLAAAPLGLSSTDLAAAGIGASAPPVGTTSLATPTSVPTALSAATPLPGALPAAAPVRGVAADRGVAAGRAPVAPASGAAIIYGEGRLGATQIAPGTSATDASRPTWNPEADPLRDTGLEAQPGNAAPVLVSAPAVAPVADAGPNIVEYALAAPNAKGQEWYSRFAFARGGRSARNCADYRSPDEAQRDFLRRGGPERDARGLDPDGDGFACGWDPAPFRAAVSG